MSRDQFSLRDPRTLYPAVDAPEQTQPEPGLDRDLVPTADHGEETYRGSGRLEGRRALITGADSGIGRAVAIAFAREGADVALSYLPAEEPDAREVVAQVVAAGRRAVALPGDLADAAFCVELVGRAVQELGGLDVVVNNAGRQIYVERLEDLDDEQFERTFRTNVHAMFRITKAALPHLPAGASIVNTTSIQAYDPSPGLIDYAATKAAINNFTKGLAGQLAERGIRVNAVAPGPIWTPLQPSHGQPVEKLPHFGEQAPLGRAGQPAELASAYVFLASGESSYVSGATLSVTGGSPTP
jgi:NAD(P)-dependent dehydrogenase (short-subunit alcohol dehydrogenase family)